MSHKLHCFYLIGLIFVATITTGKAQSYKAIATEGDVAINDSIVGTRALRPGDPIPYGSFINTGSNGGAILQKGDSFTIVQVTRNTRVRIDYKGLHKLSNFWKGRNPFNREAAIRFIPTQGAQVPTMPIDTFDIEEGAIIGNYNEPVAINTILGYAYIDGTVPTQLYTASFAGNGRPSRAVPRAKTTHKVLWYQKEGKGEIKPKPKVLKQVLDPKRGDKIPPDATVRALFDVAEAELMAQSDIARLLTPEDMEEEPITGFPEPSFDKVQPDSLIGATADFFNQINALATPEAQNQQVLSKTGEVKVNTIANELLNNPQQTIKDLAQILGVPLPDNLTPQQIAQLIQLAKTLPSTPGSSINTILGNQTLSQIVPELTPPATTPF
jgi:hypothetical protein